MHMGENGCSFMATVQDRLELPIEGEIERNFGNQIYSSRFTSKDEAFLSQKDKSHAVAQQEPHESKSAELRHYYRRRIRKQVNNLVKETEQVEARNEGPSTLPEDARLRGNPESLPESKGCVSRMVEKVETPSIITTPSSIAESDLEPPCIELKHIDHLSEDVIPMKSRRSEKASPKLSAKKLRVCRELMSLTSDNYFVDNENAELLDSVDFSDAYFPARKRRKIQGTNQQTKCSSDKNDVLKSGNTGPLQRDAHPKWRAVTLEGVDPAILVGCKCKILWPMEKDWFSGVITHYTSETGTHHIDYDDGDKEDLVLAQEVVKLYLSNEEMISRNLKASCETEGCQKLDFQEMAVLAASFENFQEEFGHGELIWAKIKGYPMWPAFVMDEKHAIPCGLGTGNSEGSLPVQFLGSYEYARISSKQALSFYSGLLAKIYLKCKKMTFDRGLEEAQRYLKEGKLPEIMSKLQEDVPDSNAGTIHQKEEDEDFIGDERTHKTKKSIQSLFACPIKVGDLQVLCLGKIVRDSEHFHDEQHIWPEGYVAVRKFASLKDPSKLVDYKMEVLKDPVDRTRPLFRVISEGGELIEGSNPTFCWKKLYKKLDKARERFGKVGPQSEKKRRQLSSGDFMFGFSNAHISKLIQALPYARVCSKFAGWFDKSIPENAEQLLPAGYKAVEVDWKHADRCNVCYLDEEYTNNLFLQCDKCRILVHMHCYGESELPNGHLWLCQLCRPAAPMRTPHCCLCPVQGGAMKRTTDGRWAHLTCAMWIPETCFVDVKQMEPIDGIKLINKERWKLTCSICKVPYGVCIQCSELSCRVSYHVLCARSAGFVFEVLEDSSHKGKGYNDELDQPVQLLSYCRRHRQGKEERDTFSHHAMLDGQKLRGDIDNPPLKNESGCARTEAYNSAARRGRQEPAVRAAASAKRQYVEKMPYHVGGFSRSTKQLQTRRSLSQGGSKDVVPDGNRNDVIVNVGAEDLSNVLSVSDRYHQMRSTLKLRLTFGKSSIHGWGVFAKKRHRAGDMVIEYAGETVRPIVADLRERFIYNSLVGAGTYMFRIDDVRVVDATRVGSIAHLINHSCEPNCFSRVVTISGEEHIIIFAKRDINEGEELSYDYRFTSKGEQLDCHCGFPSCRGFVNADDDEEEPAKILVPRSEITVWIPTRC